MTLTNANVPQGPATPPKTVAAPTPQAKPTQAQPQPPVPDPVDPNIPVDEIQEPVYDLPKIRAVPLGNPDFDDIKPKNPMHQLRWVNRFYQNGFRVGYHSAQGFRPAKKADVLNCPPHMIDPTGVIVNGDRILMIIGKNAYHGALLHNHNQAIRRGSKFGQVHQNWREDGKGNLTPVDEPTDVMQATLNEVRASQANKSKIRSFIPAPDELSAKFAEDKNANP